jgi:release factor glutamine methyltransferase
MASIAALLLDGAERLRIAGSPSARLDAELLLGHAIGADRTAVLAHPEVVVVGGPEASYRASLDRRAAGEPVAYIRGMKEFHGLAFAVDARALIPRPETERLVELGTTEVMARLTTMARAKDAAAVRVADVGTGSGAVAISLGVALRQRRAGPDVRILGTDVSPAALELAVENAVGHALADRVRFVEADLLPPVLEVPFDVILANLPYIRSDAIASLPIAASFEPTLALDGGADGLDVISRLLERLPDVLAPDGVALLEIGSDQDIAITERVGELLPGWSCSIEPDLAGLPRVARVERVARVAQAARPPGSTA